jgi:hypothetical protein
MSEEENPEEVEARKEQEQVDRAKEEAVPNALYKTLFDVAEEVESDEEDTYKYKPPVELNEAVLTLDDSPEQAEDEPAPEAKEEPKKAEPKKKKLRKVVDPDIPEDVLKQPAFNQKQDEDTYRPSDEDVEFMNELIPEEKVVYEKILYADNRIGGEYEGKAKQFKEFFKKNKEFVDKRISEDDFYDPSSDDDYRKFVEKNKPNFNRVDEDKVYREMILEEADRRINKKTTEKISQIERQLRKQQTMPRINQAKAMFRKTAQGMIPKDVNEKIVSSENGLKEFAENNPLEYQILERNTQEMLQYSDALTDIFLDPDIDIDVENNPTHQHLNEWINTQQDQFIKTGQTQLEDGRTFMRRERYYQLPENKRSEYYTWDDNSILNLLAFTFRDRMQAQLEHHRQAMEKAGYQKVDQGQQPQPQQPQPQQFAKPPVLNPSPRQGSSVESRQAQKPQNALLNTLGL